MISLSLSLSLSLSFQCWSSDTYHLWMLPTTISRQNAGWALFRRESSSSDREVDNPSSTDENKGHDGGHSDRNCYLLVMRFMKNSIVDNPIIVSTDIYQYMYMYMSTMIQQMSSQMRERERERGMLKRKKNSEVKLAEKGVFCQIAEHCIQAVFIREPLLLRTSALCARMAYLLSWPWTCGEWLGYREECVESLAHVWLTT